MGFYHNTTYSFWDKRYPDKEWVEYMNNSIKELVDLYHPDILWGDVVVSPYLDENGKPLSADHWNSKEVIAYFYNHSKNPDEVVLMIAGVWILQMPANSKDRLPIPFGHNMQKSGMRRMGLCWAIFKLPNAGILPKFITYPGKPVMPWIRLPGVIIAGLLMKSI